MKLATLQEAKYGSGLSQKEREELVYKIRDNIKISNVDHDDWRITLDVDDNRNVDYYEVLNTLTELFGEPTLIDGYSSGVFHKKTNPQWIIKDHQLIMSHGYGDTTLEISKL